MDWGRTVAALLALAACIASSTAAPMASNQTALELLEGSKDGCYYNFQHYGENDRIMTNEPCLNCTCHNRMLMCYLRVCPFTKAIGQDCTIEKRADQCCPIVTCPDVPVDLLTSTSTSSPAEYGATGLGKLDKYGCSINGKYFSEGAKVPPSPNKPCEHCYCIRNMTTCVMQECTLHVDGCTPIYHKDVCCPVRYSCDHPEDETLLLDDMTTTVRPTPGFLLTTTTTLPVTQATQDCIHSDQIFADGALIKTEKACEHCYCMKGDIVCVVQECGTPMENEGKNCTSLPPRHGQCCPDTYICEGDEFGSDMPTEIPEVTTSPPRRTGVEGSGYRNEPDESFTEVLPLENTIEGSGEENLDAHTAETSIPEKITPEIIDLILTTTETSKIQNTIADGQDNDISKKEEITTQTTDTNIGAKVTQDDIKTSYHERSTVTSEYQTSSPVSNAVSLDGVTTESLEKTDENVVTDEQKPTSHDLIHKTTTKEEYLDENDLITTEKTEENIGVSDKKTTQDLGSKTTKQDFDSTHYVTTESLEKIEDGFIVDGKKTTMHDFVDELTPMQEHSYDNDLVTTESVQIADENVSNDDKKTTVKQLYSETNKQEQLDNFDFVTTESINKVDAVVVFDSQKTTIKDNFDETTNQEYNDLVTTESIEKADDDSNVDRKKTTTQDLSVVTTKQEYFDENVSVTTEATEKSEENSIVDIKKTTIKDFIDETTKQGHLGDNDLVTTEPMEKADENIVDDVEKTTIKNIVDEIIKQDHLGDKDSATTESIEKIDKNIMSDNKETIAQIFDVQTTLKEEHTTTKIDDIFDLEHSMTTQVPEHTLDDKHTISAEEYTTQTSVDKSELSEVTMREKELYTTKTVAITESYTTRENLNGDKTTPVNVIENEIIENVTPTLLPSRIPGEGDCLLNSVTYVNNSIVPSTNNCHTSCKCISSIIKCNPIICSPPPEYMNDCEPFYDSPDSCCPTYLCNTKEAIPPQPHNQMSNADDKKNVTGIECDTSDCTVQKKPSRTTSDCSGNECASSDQLCDKESGCLETVVVPSCEGKNCDKLPETSSIQEIETNAHIVPVTDCEDESACKKPVESNIQGECFDEQCKIKQNAGVDRKPSLECLGSDCVQDEKGLSSELPATELPESDYSSTKTTSETDLDKKEEEVFKPTEINTPTNEAILTDVVTQEPTILTTVKTSISDIFTEKVVTEQPFASNEKVTKGSESVTEISSEMDSTNPTKPTALYEIKQDKTDTLPEVPSDEEYQVAQKYDQNDNKPHTSHTVTGKEHDNAEIYETSTKVLYPDEHEQSSHITTLTALEDENPITTTSFSDIHGSESDNKLVTPITEKEHFEKDKTPASEIYVSTEYQEIITGYPEKATTESSKISESEYEQHSAHPDSLTTIAFEETNNMGTHTNDYLLTTEQNLKVSEPTAITHMQHEMGSESPTTDGDKTSQNDLDNLTHSITESESLSTQSPEVLVTVKQEEDSDTDKQNQYSEPVTNNFEDTTKTYTSIMTELPLHTENEEKVTVTSEQTDTIQPYTESNGINKEQEVVTGTRKDDHISESPQISAEDRPVGENILPVTEKDVSSLDILSDVQTKETVITSTSEKSTIKEEISDTDKTTNISILEQNINTESPELNKDEVITEQAETQTNIPYLDVTDKHVSEGDNLSIADKINKLTTSNILLTTEAQPVTVSYQTDFNNKFYTTVSHLVEQTTYDDSLSTENIISVTKEQLFTNSPQEVDTTEIDTSGKKEETSVVKETTTQKITFGNTQSEIDTTEKKEKTSVIEEITTQKIAYGNTENEHSAAELSTPDNQERTTEVTTVTKISETAKEDETLPSEIFDTATETNGTTTEFPRRSTQQSEYQNIPSQEDMSTRTDELFSSNTDITTVNPERTAEEEKEKEDIPTILDDKEQNIKPIEITTKQDDATMTTKATILDSDLSNTSPYALEPDTPEPSFNVDIKESEENKFSEKPESHVTEAISDKNYNTEPITTIINVEISDKNVSPGFEVTESEPNIHNIITVRPDLHFTNKEEMVTKESPITLPETETKSPDFSDVTLQASTEKEYTKLPQLDDTIPHIATTISPVEESTDIKMTPPILTESHTEIILHERTTLKSFDSELQPVEDSSTVQTPNNIIGEENIKSTMQEHYPTIAETPVTEAVEYHVEEQKPLRENESNTDKSILDITSLDITTEKITTEVGTQKHTDITTKPTEHVTDNSLLQVDVSTEHSIEFGKDEEVVTSQDEIKTESPYIQYEKFSTVGSKSTEEEETTGTIHQDQKEITTPTPETTIQNEVSQPKNELEKTTHKQTATTEIEPELITTESSLTKETSSINLSVSLVTEKAVNDLLNKQVEPHEQSGLYTTVTQIETTSPNILSSENNDVSTIKSATATEIMQIEPEIPDKSAIDYAETSDLPDVTRKDQNYATELPGAITTVSESQNDLLDEKQNIDKTTQIQNQTPNTLVTEINQLVNTNPPDFIEGDVVTKDSAPSKLEDISTLSSIAENTITEESVIESHSEEPQKVQDDSGIHVTETTIHILSETPEPNRESNETQNKYSETTPYLIELEEHTHQIKDDITSGTSMEEELTTMSFLSQSTERGDQADKLNDNNVSQGEQNLSENKPAEGPSFEDAHKTTYKEEMPTTISPSIIKGQESSTKYTTAMEEENTLVVTSSSVKPIEDEMHTVSSYDTEKYSSPATETEILPEKEIHKDAERTETPVPEKVSPSEDVVTSTHQSTTVKAEEITTQSVELDKISKPDVKPVETYFTPETPKPEFSEAPTDEIQSPDFPPSGSAGYGQEPDYGEEDQTFGPGTCRYGGKVYVSAQQIPRDDPCDFCFCFRSDIICLQQSCPPPIHGCHEEPIQGFCCPRYECPVSMATAINVTTTTTTTTTTVPPHFLPHAYKGAAHRRGCQIKGHTYKVGEVVRASSGPCLHCTCGGDGQMKCDPKVCTPEPMLRQMIAAAVSAKRRR